MIKQYNITNLILIISLYMKMNKYIVSSVPNKEHNTNWQLGIMSGKNNLVFSTDVVNIAICWIILCRYSSV